MCFCTSLDISFYSCAVLSSAETLQSSEIWCYCCCCCCKLLLSLLTFLLSELLSCLLDCLIGRLINWLIYMWVVYLCMCTWSYVESRQPRKRRYFAASSVSLKNFSLIFHYITATPIVHYNATVSSTFQPSFVIFQQLCLWLLFTEYLLHMNSISADEIVVQNHTTFICK